ncbi:MAG: aminotransferase class I/II-fold pyridoxal phosphate-dependent enzyme, partial [Candidatus Bathyarchaeota archaeon]|nr:aminotransferase class I/II-fold pyridoxal phosphate-dependent enzyme [Candidatus Bathyarchaeota archaeon]
MRIEPFAMERFQSLWENVVEYNLSESGVHPLRLEELASRDELQQLVQTPLGYNQTNGSLELRATVASLYEGGSVENVLVTTGSSEANFLSILCLIEKGDEVALMLPNYMQIWGASRAFGADVRPFHLVPTKDRWQLDWEEFDSVVSKRTKLIAVCNPNNPTGAQLGDYEIDRICDVASRADAWILSDEVYRGAERIGDTTPSFWGHYDKVIVVCGLSKAYGLPGLRIGWIVAPPA